MNRLLSCGLITLSVLLFSGCASNEKLTMGGVPKWLSEGAKIDSEPEPFRPDPAIIHYEEESGPVEWKLITDKRNYPTPSVEKKKSVSTSDPLERGRDYRIRRLFR